MKTPIHARRNHRDHVIRPRGDAHRGHRGHRVHVHDHRVHRDSYSSLVKKYFFYRR